MSDSRTPDGNPGKGEKKEVEVRYVPVEYMADMHEVSNTISLVDLVRRVWDGRWMIIKITALFIFLGLFVALFSPVEYESQAILMPEAQQQQQGGASRLLQQFGGQFGITTGNDMPAGTIPPQLYPRIVNSTAFQLELLNKEIYFRDYDVTTTWPDFLENHYSRPLTSYLVDYTVGLPFTILRSIRRMNRTAGTPSEVLADRDDPMGAYFIEITLEEHQLVENLKNRITVNQDQQTGLLTTRVKLQDARAAAELNRFLIDRLVEYITDYRIEKAKLNLEFIERQREEARERFETAQLALAEFMDRNVTITSARARTEQETLQDEKNITLNIYNSLNQSFEEARLRVQEETPLFKEVQSVNVPTKRSEPKRAVILAIYTILGGMIALGYVIAKPIFVKFASEVV